MFGVTDASCWGLILCHRKQYKTLQKRVWRVIFLLPKEEMSAVWVWQEMESSKQDGGRGGFTLWSCRSCTPLLVGCRARDPNAGHGGSWQTWQTDSPVQEGKWALREQTHSWLSHKVQKHTWQVTDNSMWVCWGERYLRYSRNCLLNNNLLLWVTSVHSPESSSDIE